MHDTHAHLELLLQKLELLDFEGRELDLDLNDPNIAIDYFYPKKELEKLIKNHDFVIQAGVSAKNFLLSYRLFSDLKNIHFLIGSHPEIINERFDLKNYFNEQKRLLKPFLDNPKKHKIIGVGEIGLDYSYSQDKGIKKIQRNLFENEIQLAIDLNLPIQIHTRDAWKDTFAILKNFPKIENKFLVHCFTGGLDELEKITNLGGLVGYNGITTFKNAKELQETVKVCPNQNFVLETDLPFLAPTPHRGKTCLPEHIDHTAEFIGNIKNLDKNEIWKISEQNTKNLYSI